MDDRKLFERRRKIADMAHRKIGLNRGKDNLYGGIKGSFHSWLDNHGHAEQFLADQEMWRVPFFVIAKAMTEAVPNRHVIDHAWWLIAMDPEKKVTYEPWGFVTEPYLDKSDATIATELNFSSWGIEMEILTKEQSAWNPGSTLPIVVTVQSGYLRQFLKYGVAAALEML